MNKPAVGWPDTDHPRTPSGWAWAPNLLPPVAPAAWPRGIQRNASEAESILSEAVAWWDPTVSGFRDGDRWLRNSGTAGGLLDLRLGSSTVANTNDPKWLGPEDVGYVYLPGVASNYLRVPDEAALDITGDIDIRVRVALDDWTPSATSTLASKWTDTGSQQSWALYVTTAGALNLIWSTTGADSISKTSTSAINVSDGAALWVRATLDVDNGASGNDVKFFTSNDGVTWTQLGTTVTTANVTSIYSSTTDIRIGSRQTGTQFPATGKFYRAQVLNGIDGTTVLDVDCDAITSGGATSFTATTGQTVTINRSTSGRKTVAMPNRWSGGRACFLFGTDDYFEVPSDRVWQHQLLNFGQGDSFTVVVVARSWHVAPSTGHTLIAKSSTLGGATPGYVMYWGGGDSLYSYVQDGTAAPLALQSNTSYGTIRSAVSVRNVVSKRLTTFINGTTGIPTTDTTAGTLATSETLRIGRISGTGTRYADIELVAAAIFRRSLTAAEIQSITRYYGA